MVINQNQTVIIAPDSFKGTISSPDICKAIKRAINEIKPDINVVSTPIADGGEGTADCFFQSVLNGQSAKNNPAPSMVTVKASDPYFNKIDVSYPILPNGTAIIEMAVVAGLPLVGDRKDPTLTTTFGVGELIKSAVEHGAKQLVLALGGSATNDGGAGMASALGVKFYDHDKTEFIPIGKTLKEIARIEIGDSPALLKDIPITVMCDVVNPLCGNSGAAAVYARQKGADEDQIKLLDNGLFHLASIIKRDIGVDILDIPGSGAAGGMGGGAVAFLKGELVSGIDVILDTIEFDRLLDNAALVITGEGRVDGQSVCGKAIAGVAKRAKAKNVPVVVIAGDIGDNIEPLYDLGITAIMSTNRIAAPYQEQRKRAESDIELTAKTLFKLLGI